MAEKKQKALKITTPKGVAMYPWLTKPDTKFNPTGEYRMNLLVPQEEAQGLIEQLDQLVEAAFQKAVEEAKPADKKKVGKDIPYETEADADSGEATGNIKFKFKLPAQIKKKDGTVITLKPTLFDSKGSPVTDVAPYSGSIVKVNFTPRPYFMQSTKKAGVSLRLNAVQIIELVSGSGSASDYGFGEEEGFVQGEAADTLNDGSGAATPDETTGTQDF